MLKILNLALAFMVLVSGPAFAKPQTSASEPPAPEISVNEMLGAMLMFGFRGSAAQKPQILPDGTACNLILFDRDVTAGGDRNILSPEQLRQLTAAVKEGSGQDVFIAVDQEGGQVRRLKPQKGFMDLPSAQSMGQRNVEETLKTAEELGRELRSLGVNVDLAPVVDVDSNPYNPAIGRLGRAFSSDPALVSAHALAFGRGLAKNGVIPVLKHFPGQGCADADTHLGLSDVSACWRPDVDLLPYAEIFQAGWPGMVMAGHVMLKDIDPDLPASLSRNVITGLLREGMNWQGVVITDDLQMKAVSGTRPIKDVIKLALDAGVDILLYGNNLEWDPELPAKVWYALQELMAEGSLTEERIRQSWNRISALRSAFSSLAQNGGS